jgi:RNA polymerase sigma-70 factor, ECF subfamily
VVAGIQGPDAALTLVDGLDLGGYYLLHAVRADLLRRLGRTAEAAAEYEAAMAGNPERRRARLPAAQQPGSPAGLIGGRG